MKTKLITLFLMIASVASAFEAKLTFTAVPATAKIYFDGQLMGTGTATITLERAMLVEVKIVNEGYVTFERSYRYGKGSQFAKNQGLSGYERGNNSYTITLDIAPLEKTVSQQSAPKTKEERLIELKQLYDKQLISEAEYEETRKKILIE